MNARLILGLIVAMVATVSLWWTGYLWAVALMPLGFMGYDPRAGLRMPTTPPASGAGKGAASVQGLTLVDSVAREIDVTAVDTWTAVVNVGTAVEGNIQVPVGGQYLSLAEVALHWDLDNTPIGGLSAVAGIRLTGNAIKKGGTHQYLIGGASIAGHTSGGAGCRIEKVVLPMKIEMVPSNTLKIEAIMMGEDAGAVTVAVAMTFTKEARAGGIEDGDFRVAVNTAAVDTWTAATYVGATAEGSFKVPIGYSNLAAVGIVASVDAGDLAASVRAGVMVRLTGNGLASGGTFTFLNDGMTLNVVTTGMAMCCDNVDQSPIDLAVVPGNVITAEGLIIGEDPGTMCMGVQLFWGE